MSDTEIPTLDNDGGSWDEINPLAGLAMYDGIFRPSEPGTLWPMDADLTIYWPTVNPMWEERKRCN